VVPAFNEEENIARVIKTMPSFVDRIIVVDDSSRDRTFQVASGAGDERVSVIRHEVNQGVGAAIVSGHKRVIEAGGDISVVMAGDGQMDPKYLPSLLDAIIEMDCDYAKGNRFLEKGSLRAMPKLRVLGNMGLTFLNKLASGYWHIFDPQNGYTAIKTSVLRELDFDNFSKGYEFENDMLIELSIRNKKVKDVSMPAVYTGQKSKIRLYRFIPRMLLFFVKKFFYRVYQKYMLRDFHPFALLFIPGLALFWWGLLFGAYIVYLRYFTVEHISPSTGTVILSMLPLLMGFQMLLYAFILDVIESSHLA